MPEAEVIALSESEKDYSDYFQIAGNTLSILALLSGFTFTGITILLSQFPFLDSLRTQLILFFLACLFFLFMFMMTWFNNRLMSRCRNLPPVTREIASFNRLIFLGWTLLQLAVPLMFLIWNLTYLSLASGTMLALFTIALIETVKVKGRLSYKGEGKT
jgi:hypothetical protein